MATYDWHLTPAELSGLFISKGWVYGMTPLPAPADIESIVSTLVSHHRKARGSKFKYNELGRFVVFKDQEFPNSYEIFLRVGFVQDETGNAITSDEKTEPSNG